METETLYSIAAGIGLSAACGFRVFVPFFLMSLGALTGYYEPAGGFAWVGTVPAAVGFGTATLLEVLGYAIPWVDNALDAIATPAAVVAGVVASASVLGDFSPMAQWALAAVGGGGAAGLVQGGTVAARGASSAGTGGLGNFVVAAGEGIASVVTTVLAFAAPLVVVALLLIGGVFVARWLMRRRRRRKAPSR